jgi:hypothetical protein
MPSFKKITKQEYNTVQADSQECVKISRKILEK